MAFVFSDRDLDPDFQEDLFPEPDPILIWHFTRSDSGEEYAASAVDRADQFEAFLLSGLSFSVNRFFLD